MREDAIREALVLPSSLRPKPREEETPSARRERIVAEAEEETAAFLKRLAAKRRK